MKGMVASVHCGAQPAPKRFPVISQGRQLARLLGECLGQHVQLQNFLVEQEHVSIRQNAFINHRPIAVIGLAAQDNALVGFSWGHGHMSRHHGHFVNGDGP